MADSIHVLGEGGVLWEMDLPLAEGVAQRLERGDLVRVNPDGSPFEDDAGEAPAGSPPKTASKAAWVDYAVTVYDVDRGEAEGLTKAELVELYGG